MFYNDKQKKPIEPLSYVEFCVIFVIAAGAALVGSFVVAQNKDAIIKFIFDVVSS